MTAEAGLEPDLWIPVSTPEYKAKQEAELLGDLLYASGSTTPDRRKEQTKKKKMKG